jgi:hypothetical protein
VREGVKEARNVKECLKGNARQVMNDYSEKLMSD